MTEDDLYGCPTCGGTVYVSGYRKVWCAKPLDDGGCGGDYSWNEQYGKWQRYTRKQPKKGTDQ